MVRHALGALSFLIVMALMALHPQRAMAGGGVELFKDINPGAGGAFDTESAFVILNGILYFAADDGVHGLELWKTDGTPGGTALVKDIYPGPAHGLYSTSWFRMVASGGVLYLTATDGVHGFELWKSDGTAAGTVMVKDILYDPSKLNFFVMKDVGGVLFFVAADDTNARGLWKSDGTASGTVLVKDINPANDHYGSPTNLTEMNGRLFFCADDGTNGFELWTSNGNAAATMMVKNIGLGRAGTGDLYSVNVNGTLYFAALDETGHENLWKSDGTAAGTVRVKALDWGRGFYVSVGGGHDNGKVDYGGEFYFQYHDILNFSSTLWKTDGTEAGTVRLKHFISKDGGYCSDFKYVNKNLLFTVDDGVHGRELWKSDGTEAGTVMVKDINPAASSDPVYLVAVNGTLYFRATDGAHGMELWRSDGTEAGTVRITDINPGANDSSPGYLTELWGTLFFTASDGVHGNELWRLADKVPVELARFAAE